MSGRLDSSRLEVRERVQKLRGHLGLFSFQDRGPTIESVNQNGSLPELGIRSGGIVEFLVTGAGAGASTYALEIMSRSVGSPGVWAIVDLARECYVPALSGWGIDPGKLLVLRPATLVEACWAIEQCLRCPGVSATWASVDGQIPERVHRRWQLAAEAGGCVGLIFRPDTARREAVWADLRLLVTPQAGGNMETRRMKIEVLYRRGGRGGNPQSWEIDHAAGVVRLVPEVANPASLEHKARA
jgi:protein ImuA